MDREEVVKRYLDSKANPEPVYVLGGMILVTLVLYVAYLILIKPCARGIWLIGDRRFKIWHNRLTGYIEFKLPPKVIKGRVNGQLVVLDDDSVWIWSGNQMVNAADRQIIRRFVN